MMGETLQAPAAYEETAARLHSVAIHLLRRLRRHDRESGLTGPRLSALSVVAFGGPVTLGELAAAEQVRPPTMSRLATALESDGLVRRESDPADGRIVWIRATPEGIRVLEEGRRRRVAGLARLLEQLDIEELDRVGDAVELLERVLRPAS